MKLNKNGIFLNKLVRSITLRLLEVLRFGVRPFSTINFPMRNLICILEGKQTSQYTEDQAGV